MSKSRIGRRTVLAGGLVLGTTATVDAATRRQRKSQAAAIAGGPWIGFLHSTDLDPDLEEAFYAGLRDQGYEADPTNDPGSRQRLNVLSVEMKGRYKASNLAPIRRAVRTIIAAVPATDLKAIVAVGGVVTGTAAAAELRAQSKQIPLITLVGRPIDTEQYQFKEGFYFDDNSTAGGLMTQKVNRLMNVAGLANANDVCLVYNGNAAQAAVELSGWNSLLSAAPFNVQSPKSFDVRLDENTHNKDINLRQRFDDAVGTPVRAKAIVLSSDPYFARHMEKIARIAKRLEPIPICFPVHEYLKEAGDAQAGTSFAIGPKLSEAYNQIGKTVGMRLAGNSVGYLFGRLNTTAS
jgi:hypothetical protein